MFPRDSALPRRRLLLGVALLAAVPPVRVTLAAEPAQATINIDNFFFTPAAVTIAAGTQITWENRDDIPHVVMDAAEPRTFRSQALDTGDKFSHVFAAPGTYRYFCSLHPHMQGSVTVT